jgi:cobalt-zinc-cadmium efflux system protein
MHDSRLGHQRINRPGLRTLGLAFILTACFGVVELLAGIFSGSLTLISDAGHMATDATALSIALAAQFIARRPPSASFSYGYGRVEALAAFTNGLLLFALTCWIVVEAFNRITEPHAIHSTTLILIAAVGLLVNLLVAWILSKDKHDLNTGAALAHVWGDLLGSFAALLSGFALLAGAPVWIDPLLSLVICTLIFRSAWGVCRTSFHILMEGVPHQVDLAEVISVVLSIHGVREVHNLHVWELAPGQIALTAHLQVESMARWPEIWKTLSQSLHQQGIDHITIQPEEVS